MQEGKLCTDFLLKWVFIGLVLHTTCMADQMWLTLYISLSCVWKCHFKDVSGGYMYVQGTFVLQDNRFRWLTRMSIEPSSGNSDLSQADSSTGVTDNKAQPATSMHLYFPCGIIRGALTNLGIPCAVSADMSNLPACELQALECFSSFAKDCTIALLNCLK